jgi:hypothetical protein
MCSSGSTGWTWKRTAIRFPAAFIPGIALILVICCLHAAAQCRLPRNSATEQHSQPTEPLLPEEGLLSDTTYSSLYFGFSFDLPIPLEGHRIMLPIRLSGEHALLGLGFQNGKHYGTLEVTAGGRMDEGSHNMTPEEAQQKLDDIARSKAGGAPMEHLDYTPVPIKLKRVDKHAGEVHGTRFSARIRDYMVHFTIQTNDKSFLEKSRRSVESLHVFCTDASGNFFTQDGKAFKPMGVVTDGPTIPTAIVDEAIRTRPAERTVPSQSYVAKGEYRIPQLELSLALPASWIFKPSQPESVSDPPDPAIAQRLDYLWQACARTLFQASAPGNTGTLEFRALDQSCMALPAPGSITDHFGAEALGEYLQMLGRYGKMQSARLVELGGHLFSVYRGNVGPPQPAQDLEHRSAQIIVATRYRKLILTWRWTAPTQSDLHSIPATTVSLGGGPPLRIGPAIVLSR